MPRKNLPALVSHLIAQGGLYEGFVLTPYCDRVAECHK
ncbi:hypothetical protein CO2235_90290 [Cupriavidus oxalaticus]|uniref:Uncharacterized protein n=1 Tax=Cupriavidus oxalaticus TaxID=96344 RepID=A0A375GF57_9BURK|nr:hypothetical protein CO2235_90290 [Cupriavidus oxalaticus]